jgi:hypothetical protein
MKAPDGTVRPVPANQVAHYKSRGATVVAGGEDNGRVAQIVKAWQSGTTPAKKDVPAATQWLTDHGQPIPQPLTPTAQTVVVATQPVLDQVGQLLGDIDKMRLGDKNTPGYLAWDRAKYAMGMSSPEGSLGKDIAGLSLGSVVEAAAALKGATRSLNALKIALEHTPNVWVDSPKLIKEKLQTIQKRLEDVIHDAKVEGVKGYSPGSGGVVVGAGGAEE